ncbi:MAG: type II secretion system protein GspM [Pseudomonadota bacterium]
MSGLIDNARNLWSGRSLREQRLLMFMAGLLTCILLWFAIITPTLNWRENAAERRAEAEADLLLIEAGAARIAGGASSMGADQVLAAARRAADAGGVNAVFNPLNDGVGFSINGATTAALFGWLAALHAEQGIEARTLTVSENADATLNAEGLLVGPPAQSGAR